jgi:hypothetical protein
MTREELDPLNQPLEVTVQGNEVVITGPRSTHRAMTIAAAQETLLRLAKAITEANINLKDGKD